MVTPVMHVLHSNLNSCTCAHMEERNTWRKAAAKTTKAENDSAVLRDAVRPRTVDESSSGMAKLPPSRRAGDFAGGEGEEGAGAGTSLVVGSETGCEDSLGAPMAVQHRPSTKMLRPKRIVKGQHLTRIQEARKCPARLSRAHKHTKHKHTKKWSGEFESRPFQHALAHPVC